ncbi:hypothetical protein [Fibrella forsythiae]|uniref:DUF4421 domain-containing protein n=1 Tax=Fibrella forsythiae TaxID=2817061 RepID=A0ABS3JND7_9BACT|nr:hypothetical protein [Fibrella forsythiae]MBO0951495.1 hypothetical protein [Fibrella forsythiae]
MNRQFTVALLGTLLCVTVAYGQTEPTRVESTTQLASADSVRFQNHRYNEFFRGNRDFSYVSPSGELGAPGRYVINGELIASYFLLASQKSRLAIAVTQRFMARTRTDRSSPIRTPSFRLGTQVFYRLSSNVTQYRYVEAQFFHHSNGQDGPVFRPNGTYNTETGDFSTNYLQATYNWGTHLSKRHGTYYSLGYRWHAPVFNSSEGLAGNYGFGRVLGQATYRIFSRTNDEPLPVTTERLRVTLQASYAVNKLDNWLLAAAQRRVNAELSVWYIPSFSRDAGIFATAGYYGEDPYNIYFNDRYAFVRFGIAAGFTRYTDEPRK